MMPDWSGSLVQVGRELRKAEADAVLYHAGIAPHIREAIRQKALEHLWAAERNLVTAIAWFEAQQ